MEKRNLENSSTSSSSLKYCDIVMKGGITSGVVYPGTVAEIAKQFQLRGIGGTSAGAIAAAAAAAAEHGRLTNKPSSFQEFAKLPIFLGRKNPKGVTNLFTFFQPQPKTKRTFNAIVGALEAKSALSGAIGLLCSASFSFPLATILGIVPGGILIALAVTKGAGILTIYSAVVGMGLVVLGPLVVLPICLIFRFGRVVPKNLFGLCSGMSTDSHEDRSEGPPADGQSLTVWLTKYLNQLAGLDPDGPPLTFGQLWWPRSVAGSKQPDTDPSIRLEMYTTCLSKGRPFRLPFENNENVRENIWYYRDIDFNRLFPPSVLQWMKDHPRTHSVHAGLDRNEFRPMPDPWNLPVVVAARMSLSFPILLSAVPLFAYHYDVAAPIEAHGELEGDTSVAKHRPERDVISRFWFSDGGISSNFPIHFFDAPLPRWPTFAIDLVEAPEGTKPEDLEKPWMPRNNNEGIREPAIQFDEKGGIKSIVTFISAIIGTMQNWSDNTLSRMPGFRDRIAHVGLTNQEGGLNLKMPDARIQALNKRGVNTGIEFVKRFATSQEKMNWTNHRWIRLRTMLSSVVEMVRAIDRTCADPQGNDQGYEQWIRSTPPGQAPSYQWRSEEQRLLGVETIVNLRGVASEWMTAGIDSASGAPRPRPELRPRPRT
jgi:predicted acylesterase/phospholipase RssA